MAANVTKQSVTLTTADGFATAAVAALTVPGGTSVFKGFIAVETNAPTPNAAGTLKTQTYLITSLWADA